MSKQTQATESDRDNKQKIQTKVVNQTGGELVPSGLLPIAPQAAAGGGAIEGQAALLSSQGWQNAQRQALAGQIGRVQGNQHLQRLLGPSRMNNPTPGWDIQRQPTDANALADEEKEKIEAEKAEFRKGQYSLPNYQPSTKLGKFDADYDPKTGTLRIIVKIGFNFKDAPDAPWFALTDTEKERMRKLTWSDEEKETYMSEFAGAAEAKWGGKYGITCNKPHWEEFVANTKVIIAPWMGVHPDAHFQVTVHKYSEKLAEQIQKDPSRRPRAEVFSSEDPDKQGSGTFYKDNTELRPSNDTAATATEVERLKEGLKNSGATSVAFDHDSDVVKNTGPLIQFANTLNSAYPSAPAIPINIIGYAEYTEGSGQDLAQRRAEAVALVLANVPVLHPLKYKAGSDVTQAKRVDVSVADFSKTTNLRRVSDHEFGHMLGLPDEYGAEGDERESEGHKHAEAQFEQLVSSAGVSKPAMGKDTSSIMSVGVDVLPAHYVTIKEALGKMTSKYISDSEWQITA